MSDNISVTIDMATPLVVKLEAYAKENKCELDSDTASRVFNLYEKVREFALNNFGSISDIDVSGESVNVVINVLTLDVYGDDIQLLRDILLLLDSFDVVSVDGDYLLVNVGVSTVWKAV